MHKQKLLQVPELRDRYVGGTRSLQTLWTITISGLEECLRTTHFETRYTHTDVRRLDHADIVRTVTDSEQDRLRVPLNELND